MTNDWPSISGGGYLEKLITFNATECILNLGNDKNSKGKALYIKYIGLLT